MSPNLFLSEEDTNDADYFYEIPRNVTHIDDNASERLKKYYRSLLRDDDAVLDPNSFQYTPNIISQAFFCHSWKNHEGNLNIFSIS